MNLDPGLLDIIVCPDCHGDLGVEGETARRARLPGRAGWPIRSATTSRCCWSTRPRPARRGPARRRMAPGSTSPDSTTSARSPTPTCACARWPSPARGCARGARPPRPPPRRSAAPRERPAACRDRRRPRLPAAARRARAVVPGAVRGLARPGPARLGRQPRPGRRAGARGPDTGSASAVAEAVRRGCQVVVALPAELPGRRARRGSLHARSCRR